MRIIDYLQKKHAIEVLITINDNPGIIQKKLADKSKTGSTAKQERIKEALDLDLIVARGSQVHWSAITYYTTEKGKEVCKKLSHIDDIDDKDNAASSSKNKIVGVISVDSAERWKFMKRPCSDTLLFTLLKISNITITDLKKNCKGEEAHLEDRISEAESLDLITGLHPDGPQSEIRYSLSTDGRNMAENLRRSMECQEVVTIDYRVPSEIENTVKR
ncbi:MAG: hypothetical protein WCS15_06935 [Prevotella sp.]